MAECYVFCFGLLQFWSNQPDVCRSWECLKIEKSSGYIYLPARPALLVMKYAFINPEFHDFEVINLLVTLRGWKKSY